MPAKPKADTLARLLELLQAIPHRRFASPEELTQALNSRGYAVHVRTVQRDLQLLREHLPLEVRDDSKPHGWGWKTAPPDGVAGLGTSEALMVALVERHLIAALPASMLETFRPTFDRARRRLDRLGQQAGVTRWASKVAATPVGLVGRAPRTAPGVREALAEALLLDRQVDAVYRVGLEGPPKPYRLNPLGLVLRGSAVYLVATKSSGSSAAFFALHRFNKAEVRPESVAQPDGLTLEAVLRRNHGQFGVPSEGQAEVVLHLRCDTMMAGYLQESPLGDDQVVERAGQDAFDVKVTVPDSWELRWWLLSRASSVEVLSPKAVRGFVVRSLQEGLSRYAD